MSKVLVDKIDECANFILANPFDVHIVEQKAKQILEALRTWKEPTHGRCKSEQIVESFFGLPETVEEKTEIKTDYGMLVNLVAFALGKEPTGLFQRKDFTLHSGGRSDFKIDCDALTDNDIETLAYLISKRFKFFDVIGVPAGGLKLAKALQKYTRDTSHTLLIVDDVLTTGRSMEDKRDGCNRFNYSDIYGVVIFARGKCPSWVTPIFNFWEAEEEPKGKEDSSK